MRSEVFMSTWRDIWKKSLKANRLYSLDPKKGNNAFAELQDEFEKKKKDGMIHYAIAEAYEYRHELDKALEKYKLAKDLFPVDHWKEVAQQTIDRVSQNKTAEEFFDKNNFKVNIFDIPNEDENANTCKRNMDQKYGVEYVLRDNLIGI